MRKFLHRVYIAAAAVLLSMLTASAQPMAPQLDEPQTVPLDFLAWIGKDSEWLEQQIAALGNAGKPIIRGNILETTDIATLKAANRIRAFAFLAAPGLRPPYFDLAITSADGIVRCITPYPESIAPDIGPMDFARKSFPATAADQAQLRSCTVSEKTGDYAGLGRAALRDRYFDTSGTLKREFDVLGDDAAFKAKVIDEGFFLTTEDYSGQLRLDLR